MALNRVKKRSVILVSVLVVIIVSYSLIYQRLVFYEVGKEISISRSTQVVIESLTTAGFGGDTSIWNKSDILSLFVVTMNLTGVGVIFLTIPAIIVPAIQSSLKPKPSKSSRLTNHIVLCGFTGEEDTLIEELRDKNTDYLILTEDREKAINLESDGHKVVYGDIENKETHKNANVESAKNVIINTGDKKTVNAILTIRDISSDVEIITVSHSKRNTDFHKYAGSDVSICPRVELGKSISNKITSPLSSSIRETLLSEGIELEKILVKKNSPISGRTIEQSNLKKKMGTTIIGIWKNGVFIPSPKPDTVIPPGSIILTNGSRKNSKIEGTINMDYNSNIEYEVNDVVIIGKGVVGKKIESELKLTGQNTTTIDIKDDADVVADITEEKTINNIKKKEPDSIIVALDNDESAIYATVALSSILTDTLILARCNEVKNVGKMYSAGADYVLSLSRVTQRLLYSHVSEDSSLDIKYNHEISIINNHNIGGSTLVESKVREKFGYTVIAIKRGDKTITDLGSEFEINPEDKLVVVEDNKN
jgi:Trk K+ transport system NAD-binding subunit